MSTIRETIETAYAAAAFAERNLKAEAQVLMQGQTQRATPRATASTQADKRPRPTLQAK